MICEHTVKKFCSEDISLIENYDKAIVDTTQTWHCHHRLEIQNDKIISKQELIENDLYYNRPASELIFLTSFEHSSLHSSNRSEEVYRKMSENQKCRTFSQEHRDKLSKAHIGKKVWNSGKKLDSNKMKWFNNGIKNIRCEFCPKGFIPGRTNYHVDKNKLSAITKNSFWFNNGIKNVRTKECPEGFVPGRLKK